MADVLRSAPLADMAPHTLYAILRLRAEVFVVEQDCAYLDADGRDLEPDAHHLWMEREGAVVSALRLLRDPGGEWRIGRVVTAPGARSGGLAARLIGAALDRRGGPVVLDGQVHLSDWYAGFGFEVVGEEFLEDGIPHLPIRLV